MLSNIVFLTYSRIIVAK